MREDRLSCGRSEADGQAAIDPRDDRIGVRDAFTQAGANLLLALASMVQVRANQFERPFDDFPMAGEDPHRCQRGEPFEDRRYAIKSPPSPRGS